MLGYENGCGVCGHPDRVEIEQGLMAGTPADKVAGFYGLGFGEVARHKNICSPYLLSLDEFDEMVAAETGGGGAKKRDSFRRRAGLKEADMLAAATEDALVTLKNLSRMTNRFVREADTAEGLAVQQRFLRLPVLQFQGQLLSEIRQNVKALAELDRMENAKPSDGPLGGLQALAGAIAGSG